MALNQKKLSKIRSKLRSEMEGSKIMDTKGFVQELEETYRSMWENWCDS